MSDAQTAADESMSGAAKSTPTWRSDAAALVDQQLWCFGCDIRRAEGNLLIDMGCERLAAPESVDCSSCYQVQLPTGERLTLRGFGLLCEDLDNSRAVFLHRDAFRVSWFEKGLESLPWRPEDVMRASAVPPHATEQAARLLGRAIEWVARYEQAVSERLGDGYRRQTLEDRKKPAEITASEMASRWRLVASETVREPDRIGAAQSRRKGKPRREPKPLLPA